MIQQALRTLASLGMIAIAPLLPVNRLSFHLFPTYPLMHLKTCQESVVSHVLFHIPSSLHFPLGSVKYSSGTREVVRTHDLESMSSITLLQRVILCCSIQGPSVADWGGGGCVSHLTVFLVLPLLWLPWAEGADVERVNLPRDSWFRRSHDLGLKMPTFCFFKGSRDCTLSF